MSWMEIRGPAKVTFERSGSIPVTAGQATITTRFTAPGTYVLRATANDGALSTKSDITISAR